MSRSPKPVPASVPDPESSAFAAASNAVLAAALSSAAASSAARLTLIACPLLRRRPFSQRALPHKAARVILAALLFVHLTFILSTSLVLFMFRYADPGATTLMLYRKWAYGWEITAPRLSALARIPKSIRTMTVRVEDGGFWEHHGILLSAMKNAWLLNQSFGEPVYGGSTITMQTARTIFLVPEKSYLRKYLEAIIALEMEAVLGKERILELYFNYAEWGRGVFGIEAAARRHFKKGAAALDRDEAIRLITLLSSPIRYGPYDFGRNGILRSRYAYLFKRYGDQDNAAAAAGAEAATAVGSDADGERAGSGADAAGAGAGGAPASEPAEQLVGGDADDLAQDPGTPVQGGGVGKEVGGE